MPGCPYCGFSLDPAVWQMTKSCPNCRRFLDVCRGTWTDCVHPIAIDPAHAECAEVGPPCGQRRPVFQDTRKLTHHHPDQSPQDVRVIDR